MTRGNRNVLLLTTSSLPPPHIQERTKDQKYNYVFWAFSLKKVLIESVQQNEVWQQHHSQIVSQIKTERALNNRVQIKKPQQ